MSIDMEMMLTKIKDRQWALADIDWTAPDYQAVAQGAGTRVSSSA